MNPTERWALRNQRIETAKTVGVFVGFLAVVVFILFGCRTCPPCEPAPIPTPRPPQLIHDGTPAGLAWDYWQIWAAWLEAQGLIEAHNRAARPP